MCVIKEKAIKQGTLNKVFLQVDQGIEGSQIHQRQV